MPDPSAPLTAQELQKIAKLGDILLQVEEQVTAAENFKQMMVLYTVVKESGDQTEEEKGLTKKKVTGEHAKVTEALLKLNLILDSVECSRQEQFARQKRKQCVVKIQAILNELDRILGDYTNDRKGEVVEEEEVGQS